MVKHLAFLGLMSLMTLISCKQEGPGQSNPVSLEEREETRHPDPQPTPTPLPTPTPTTGEGDLREEIKREIEVIERRVLELQDKGIAFDESFSPKTKVLLDYRMELRRQQRIFPLEEVQREIQDIRQRVQKLFDGSRSLSPPLLEDKWRHFLDRTAHDFLRQALEETHTYYDYCRKGLDNPPEIAEILDLINRSLPRPAASCADLEAQLMEKRQLVLDNVRGKIDLAPLRGLYRGQLQNLTIMRSLFARERGPIDLRPLHHLTGLKALQVVDGGLTDLRDIQGLRSLKTLDLRYNPIVDYRALRHLRQLEVLTLSHNDLTDISFLRGLTGLKALYLEDNRIADISPLEDLTNLERVELQNNQVTSVQTFNSRHRKLTFLNLGNNLVVDASPLKTLTGLRHLNLAGNRILPYPSHCPVDSVCADLNGLCQRLIEKGAQGGSAEETEGPNE